MRYRELALAVAVGLATPGVAEEPRASLGVLTCTLAKSGGDDRSGSMTCGFKPSESGAAEEKYDGSLHGLAQSAVGKQVLVWAVIGPSTTKLSTGLLAQRYARSKAPGQSPSWIGETNNTIALRFESHEGGNIANAIARLELKLSGTSARAATNARVAPGQ